VKRYALTVMAVAAAVLIPAVLAAPANAGSGPPVGGCTTGSSCQIELDKMVQFNGNYSPGTSNQVVNITPPPCLWNPIGDAHTGSQYIISFFNNTDPGPSGLFDTGASFKQAKQLVKSNPITPGEWYELPVNPAAGQAGAAECLKLPLFFFAPPATPLPGVNIPPRTLAQLAFGVLDTARLGKIQVNPKGTSDVNLATFVDVQVLKPPAGTLGTAADGRPYVAVTASIPGEDSATVWAEAGALNITTSDTGAQPYDSPDCSMVHPTDMLGSRWSAFQMSHTAVNQPIDCGVMFRQPGSFSLSASIGWTACWADTGAAVAPPAAPSYAFCTAHAVPGAGQLQASVAGPMPITVQEIQSVNGGNNASGG
jgi:hypothetical protein